jgi:hypothetical protein
MIDGQVAVFFLIAQGKRCRQGKESKIGNRMMSFFIFKT